jgi:hypothetical protein
VNRLTTMLTVVRMRTTLGVAMMTVMLTTTMTGTTATTTSPRYRGCNVEGLAVVVTRRVVVA